MDPLSITASIIAVVSVLVSFTEAAKSIWGAPDELQQLAAELNELNDLANQLDALTRDQRFRDNDLGSLEAPYSKLQEAQKIFEQRLSKRHGTNSSTSRFRRRTWILHRARIRKVTKDVVTIRTQLSTVVQSLTLSLGLSIRGIQNQHSHALTLVDERILRCQNLLQSLTRNEPTLSHDPEILKLSSQLTGPALDSQPHELQVDDIGEFLDCAPEFFEDISEVIQFYTPTTSLLGDPIEISTTCYPEDYTIEGPLYERLAIFSKIEFSRISTSCVDKYFLLFAQGGRRWRRVIVSATTTAQLRQSEVSFSFTEIRHHVFPRLVQSELEAKLEETELYNSVTHVSIEFQLSFTNEVTFDPKRSLVVEDDEIAAATETFQNMEEIEQRGIPQYVERQVQVLSRIRSAAYHVLVENQSCIQRIFPFSGTTTSDRKTTDEFIADMNLLLLAQGCPGVADFVGVVVNDNHTYLSSYLVRLPEAGSLHEILQTPSSVSWERRERWIRQIITAVAEIHKRGLKIGIIDITMIWIDLSDGILITRFKSTGIYRLNMSGYLPPELRGHTPFGALPTNYVSTFKSDLFQLGLVVWMLAENIKNLSGIFCRKSGCQSFPHYQCRADHANPVNLPLCGSEVPGYINEIIESCRQLQPSRRKCAYKLLKLLPPASPESRVFSANRKPLLRIFRQPVQCDECGDDVTEGGEYYHCSICHEGDFDLCPQCFTKFSCYNDSHKMVRMVVEYGRLLKEVMGLG